MIIISILLLLYGDIQEDFTNHIVVSESKIQNVKLLIIDEYPPGAIKSHLPRMNYHLLLFEKTYDSINVERFVLRTLDISKLKENNYYNITYVVVEKYTPTIDQIEERYSEFPDSVKIWPIIEKNLNPYKMCIRNANRILKEIPCRYYKELTEAIPVDEEK